MAEAITAKSSSLSAISEDDKDSEVLWISQMIETIRNLKDTSSNDCFIIVGETRIPVHKDVVQRNSSMLTSRSVDFDEENDVTEIEVEPEFDDKPDLVKEIVQSFYTGTIDIDEANIKEAYKFSATYDIGWLKIHSGRLIVKYLTKSVFGSYDRFTEILTFAHFVWDTDLFESCIQVIDEDVLELLMKDDEMLETISYRCMEIITTSSHVGFPEKNLFDLLVTWVACKKQTCKKIFLELFKNLRYDSMHKDFILEHVVRFVSQNAEIFSISFLKNIMDCVSDSSTDVCRSERLKENALKRVQIVLDTLESSDKTSEEKANEVNSFLIRKDIRYLPAEKNEELSETILTEPTIKSLDWLSVVNLINTHQTESTVRILFRWCNLHCVPNPDIIYKLDWTKLTDKAIIFITENYCRYYLSPVKIVMLWCLANRDTCDDVTLQRIVSGLCYKECGDVYNSNVILPTIKHLLPNNCNVTVLKCRHSGECVECGADTQMIWEIKTANEKLYKLEPFEDDVATLVDDNGVLTLTFNGRGSYLMFIKNKPYEPFYPMLRKKTYDENLRRFIASTLQDGDEIVILKCTYKRPSSGKTQDGQKNTKITRCA